MNTYLIFVVTSVIVGLVCAAVAERYRRDPVRWFIVGAALNILALVVVVAAGKRRLGDGTSR